MEKIVIFVFIIVIAFVFTISEYHESILKSFTQSQSNETQSNETLSNGKNGEKRLQKREVFDKYNNRGVNEEIMKIIEKAKQENANGNIIVKIPNLKLSHIIHEREMGTRARFEEFKRRVLNLEDNCEFKEKLLKDLDNRSKRRLIEVIFPLDPSTITTTTTTTTTTKTTLKIEVDIVPRILGMFGVVTSFDEDEKTKTCMMHEKAKEEKESGNG